MDNTDNTNVLYAHSKKYEPTENWQKLEEHLEEVANLAASFAAMFSSQDWAFSAGYLHDLGKADSHFQGYLRRVNDLDDAGYDSGRVNHSSAGAAFAVNLLGDWVGRVFAYIVAGHHAGLPDWDSADIGQAALSFRLKEGRENLERIKAFADSISTKLKPVSRPPSFVKQDNFHIWIRMLYSCLVDADFLNTEEFMEPQQAACRSGFDPLSLMKEKFDNYMDELSSKSRKTTMNSIRKEILQSCRQASEKGPGLFTLTVPTGGGKTLSSMAFALEHSIKHKKNRIVYVIPYTSIIEQTVGILSGIFGMENVVEHHSNLNPEEETPRLKLASENWDAPIIVTTNVQFFESLYAAKSSRCRKLHNIVNSVVILDEAQLLPPELLNPCVDTMNQLIRNYGVTILLATATQPALPGLDNSVEIVAPEMDLYKRLKRTEVNLPEDLHSSNEWKEIADELIEHEQVLCIVNSRRDCYELYKLMPEDTVHLSALMCGHHRSRIIRYIKWRLSKGKPIRVISTQLVEAGVDIDFPVVYRAFAGIDSIAQAAGRCNREGHLNVQGKFGQVQIFVPPKSAPPGLLRKKENAARELSAASSVDMDDPITYTRFFETFYPMLNDMGSRFNDLLTRDGVNCQFRSAAQEFKLIDDKAQRPVIVRYGKKCERLIKDLRSIGPKKDIMRKLQRYTVNLSVYMINKMKAEGLLEEICDGILVQTMPNLYSRKTGLDIFRESLPVEDLII